jgi:ABC-type uncharacterized transport system auxiliary subunit
MSRILAPLVVALAAVMAGCGQTEAPRKTFPSATEMFDKKEVPNKGRSRGAAPN